MEVFRYLPEAGTILKPINRRDGASLIFNNLEWDSGFIDISDVLKGKIIYFCLYNRQTESGEEVISRLIEVLTDAVNKRLNYDDNNYYYEFVFDDDKFEEYVEQLFVDYTSNRLTDLCVKCCNPQDLYDLDNKYDVGLRHITEYLARNIYVQCDFSVKPPAFSDITSDYIESLIMEFTNNVEIVSKYPIKQTAEFF
jgi:hypothetical protein